MVDSDSKLVDSGTGYESIEFGFASSDSSINRRFGRRLVSIASQPRVNLQVIALRQSVSFDDGEYPIRVVDPSGLSCSSLDRW